MHELGKALMALGVALFVAGAFLYVVRGSGWLPGDIVVVRKHFTFVFPVVTCVVVSIVLTLLLRWLGR